MAPTSASHPAAEVHASPCKRGTGIPVVAVYDSSDPDTARRLSHASANQTKAATDTEDGDCAAKTSGPADDRLTDDLRQHKSVRGVGDVMKVFGRQPAGGLGAGLDFDSQEGPVTEAFSPEERSALAAMESLLAPDVLASTDEETRLICLRGRKYDAERAARLLPEFMQVREELFGSSGGGGGCGGASGGGEAGTGPGGKGDGGKEDGASSAEEDAMRRQLADDLGCLKVLSLGKLPSGHTVLAARLRLHDPKASSPADMARLFYLTMIATLRADVDAQRHGVCILVDQTGFGFKNFDPRAPKFVIGSLLPRLPVRVAKIVAFNPPWIFGKVILPLFLSLMSKKLRKRITIVASKDLKKLHAIFPPPALPDFYGGSFPFDGDEYVKRMLALEI